MDELWTLNHVFCKVAALADHPESWHYAKTGTEHRPIHIWTNGVTNRRVYYFEQDTDFDSRISGVIVSMVCQGRTDRESLMRFEEQLASYLGVGLPESNPVPQAAASRTRSVPRQQGKRNTP